MESSFIDDSGYRHRTGFGIDRHLYFSCGEIADSAMEGMGELPLVVEVRGSIAFQTATNEQFIEATEPAQTGWFIDGDQRRMNRASYRRLPADAPIAELGVVNAHASTGQYSPGEIAISDSDLLDSVLQSAT